MRIVKALGALSVLLAVLVVPPWALLRFVGNPYPAEGVSWAAPLTDGAIVGLLAVVVWVLWLQLVVCVVVEVIAAFSSDRVQMRVPLTLGVQQDLARRLVTAIVLAAVPASVAATGGVATATPVAPTVEETSTVQTDTAAVQASAETPQQVTPRHDSAAKTRTETVMRLDTLWGIAERTLGDGNRFPEIAALNEGQVMNDGTVFHSADHVRAGWQLMVPDETPTAAASGESVEERVEPGDTLSHYALEHYGDANQWPKIFEANKGSSQPGGRHLVDPHHIEPGWTVSIPDVDAAPAAEEPPAEPEAGGETTPVPPAEAPLALDEAHTEQAAPHTEQAPTSAQGGAEAESAAGLSQIADVDEESGWPVRTLGGIGALLAAALVGLIAGRRMLQRRRRLPGQKMPMPGEDAQKVETEIRAVADEIGLGEIDTSLRVLAAECADAGVAVPPLRLARLDQVQGLELYFEEAAQLPPPFEATSDEGVWSIPARVMAELEEPADVAAPYPALTSIGTDADDAVLMLNLAALGSLGIVGAEPQTRHAVTAAAIEIASTPWGSAVDLVIVGALDELAGGLEPGRMDCLPDLGAADLTPEIVERVTAAHGASKVPLFVVFGEEADEVSERAQAQHARLRDLGATVVTQHWATEDAWIVKVHNADTARLMPVGVEIAPQLVDDAAYAGLLEILQTSQNDPSDQPAYDTEEGGQPQVLPFGSDGPSPTPDATASTTTPDDTEQILELEETTQDDEAGAAVVDEIDAPELGDGTLADDAQVARGDESDPVAVGEAADAGDPAAASTPKSPEADTTNDPEPTPPPVQPQQVTDPVADEAASADVIDPETAETEPGTADVSEVAATAVVDEVAPVHLQNVGDTAALWEPDLGTDAVHPLLATGHPVIRILGPTVDIVGATSDAPTSKTHRAVCTRIATYLALTPDRSRTDLVEAVWSGQRVGKSTVDSRLSNVRKWFGDNPETGLQYFPPRTLAFDEYVTTDWHVFNHMVGRDPATASTSNLEDALGLVRGLPMRGEDSHHYGFAEYVREEMVDRIVDTAYQLAKRRYMDGAWRKAIHAAAYGLVVDEPNERLWRIRIHAAHSAGRPDLVNEAIERMNARVVEFAGLDLDEETVELLEALKRQDHDSIEQAREAL